MGQFFQKAFTKRSLLGTLLLLVLIGEPTVGLFSGLFSGGGIIIFFFLYFTLFHLFESLIVTYRLVGYQVILLTFAIYSVLVTGLLNKELTEYVLKPQDALITTLIRIQASFFVFFTFYLLNKVIPRDETKVLTVKQSVSFFTIFVLLFSLTGIWGLPSAVFAFGTVPLLSIVASIAGLIALYFTFKTHPTPTHYESKKLIWLIYFFLLVGAIPNIIMLLILIITMIIGGLYILFNRTARNHLL